MQKKLLVGVAISMLAVAVVMTLPSQEQTNSASSSESPRIERGLLQSFSVLRPTAPSPPFNVQREMERAVEGGGGFSLVTAAAHDVPIAFVGTAWVVPGHGYICVMGSQPLVAGCNTTTNTIRNGMSVVSIGRSTEEEKTKTYTLFGIAPDGVSRVLIREEGGRNAVIGVRNNIYAFRSSRMLHSELIR